MNLIAGAAAGLAVGAAGRLAKIIRPVKLPSSRISMTLR